MSKSYKVKITGSSHLHKIPLFCPCCDRITGTIDDDYLSKLGICSVCVVMHVEDRRVPTIDLSEYTPPGGVFENMSHDEINSYFINQQK